MTLFVRTRTAPYVLDICNVNVQLDRGRRLSGDDGTLGGD